MILLDTCLGVAGGMTKQRSVEQHDKTKITLCNDM